MELQLTAPGDAPSLTRQATRLPINGTFPQESMRDYIAPTTTKSSYFVWEYEQSLADHIQQGPEEEWIKCHNEVSMIKLNEGSYFLFIGSIIGMCERS